MMVLIVLLPRVLSVALDVLSQFYAFIGYLQLNSVLRLVQSSSWWSGAKRVGVTRGSSVVIAISCSLASIVDS
jgi:hypothetical protein